MNMGYIFKFKIAMANANTATVTCSAKQKLQSTRQYSLDNLLPADIILVIP